MWYLELSKSNLFNLGFIIRPFILIQLIALNVPLKFRLRLGFQVATIALQEYYFTETRTILQSTKLSAANDNFELCCEFFFLFFRFFKAINNLWIDRFSKHLLVYSDFFCSAFIVQLFGIAFYSDFLGRILIQPFYSAFLAWLFIKPLYPAFLIQLFLLGFLLSLLSRFSYSAFYPDFLARLFLSSFLTRLLLLNFFG